VHTPQYVRQRSPQLFAAVLASASKFFRPELYEPLLAVADLVVERAIYGGVHTIEVVQAICLLHCQSSSVDALILQIGRSLPTVKAGLGSGMLSALPINWICTSHGETSCRKRSSRRGFNWIVNGHGFVCRPWRTLTDPSSVLLRLNVRSCHGLLPDFQDDFAVGSAFYDAPSARS